jgi:hypothetical protein
MSRADTRALRPPIRARAQGRYEYCHLPEEADFANYEIDYIIAEQRAPSGSIRARTARRRVAKEAAVMDLADYTLEALHQDGACILYRGVRASPTDGGLTRVLVVAPVGKHASPASVRRLEHEYALRTALDPRWAVVPVALVQHQGRPVLVLEDPGGEPLARLLGAPLEVGRFLRLALAIAHTLVLQW